MGVLLARRPLHARHRQPALCSVGWWLTAVGIAALQAVAHRYAISPDGISYLDIARAYLSGKASTAINAYWGPLYSLLLAVAIRFVRPSSYWEAATVHAELFLQFLCALFAFVFLLREVLRARRAQALASSVPVLSDSAFVALAYAAFIYGSLSLISVREDSPDMLVAAAVFMASGLALRLSAGTSGAGTALALGLILGVGYLAKSVMFVLAFAFLASQLVGSQRNRKRGAHVAVAAGAFLAIASALIVPISRSVGHLTFGTAGTLTYGFVVLGRPYSDWEGDSGSGAPRPIHPPRRLVLDPDVYEYTAHLRGTYPPWFDPSWWNAGSTGFNLRRQASELIHAGHSYLELFLGSPAVVVTLLIAALWLCSDRHATLSAAGFLLPVLLPSVVALVLYAFVEVLYRLVGGFVVLLWVVAASIARRSRVQEPGMWPDRLALLCAVALTVPVALEAVSDAWGERNQPNEQAIVAARLNQLGVKPGERVANAGRSFHAYWAHLAGVQIVAELPDGHALLCADSNTAARVFTALASVGARALVTRAIPVPACIAGWQRIAGTDEYVRLVAH